MNISFNIIVKVCVGKEVIVVIEIISIVMKRFFCIEIGIMVRFRLVNFLIS